MARVVKFILTGPNAGKTVELGGFYFKDGECRVGISHLENANQPLPSVDTIPEGNRDEENERAGLANAARVLRFYAAYPESALVRNADGTYSLPEGGIA